MNRLGSEGSAAGEQEKSFSTPPKVPAEQQVLSASKQTVSPGRFSTDHTRLAEMLYRISEGDKEAFTDFYHRTARKVYNLARRVIVDAEIAQETTQDIYLIVWQEAHRYNPTLGTPTGWLMTITHRRAVDRVRAEQSSTNRVARWATDNHTPDYDSVAETAANRAETLSVIKCLEDLSPLQRESLGLAYYRSMTYYQVSEYLSIPLSTVKTRIRDGLKNLRKCLEGPATK
ncbi:ECF RNA polymerase sigma factor SigK [Arthrobacter sp. AET 35A]|uniref:ECF RNA polymerase sigma factor SigK n=1 Tax=Arthrobacter sp. AET 35A TaxID=2292643 RepID=UPI001786E8EA|nr:ECF RNA polymerase sigma factor SigK [Arthrobacter sp. AET 35A]MBE0011106.1 RNA polymerase subunit sigma [Arthrobacter sp. AET 35A]